MSFRKHFLITKSKTKMARHEADKEISFDIFGETDH